MSKRNFILLIIILILIIAGVFVFFYFQKNTNTPGGDNTNTNFFSQFNPFGSKKTTTPPPSTTPPADISDYEPPTTSIEITNTNLKKISSMPVAGFVVFSKERLKDTPISTTTPVVETTTNGTIPATTPVVKKTTTKITSPLTEFVSALRYVDKTNGNIYQTFADKIEERRFSTTVIPKIYEAFFGNKGNSVVMRYLKEDGRTIQTFVGKLSKEILGGDTTESSELTGSFLPENIKDISISPDTLNLFYLFELGNNIVGTTLNLSDDKKVQVFDSPFTDWLSLWPNSKIITFTTKPSSGIPGYMYALDLSSKNFSNILSNINGLTTLTSPDGKLVLYGNDALSLSIFHTDTKTSDLLGIKTIPEKCVWGRVGNTLYCAVPKSIDNVGYPDSWYQGEVSFSDELWKIDILTGNATMVFDPTTAAEGLEIDGIKLALDDNENYLFFVNKKDSYLWEYNLK
ncbi:MAG: hypothetical protein WCP17_01995 [bacterium]